VEMPTVIPLKEYESHSGVLLTHEEVGRLRDEPYTFEVLQDESVKVEVEPASPQVRPYRVNPFEQVGLFRLGGARRPVISIEPKVGIGNVFALLGTAYQFYIKESPFLKDAVPYDTDLAPIIEPLVQRFNEVVEGLLREGLIQHYIEQEELLPTLRGKLLFHEHIRQSANARVGLFCRYVSREVDIPENQVILWTLILLRRERNWSDGVRSMLQSHILHLGGVSVRSFLPRQFPTFHYDRLTYRYQEIHCWCKLFIDLLSLSDETGDFEYDGFLLDMNLLFERFVAAMFQRAAQDRPEINVRYQPTFPFDVSKSVKIEPDLVIEGPKGQRLPIDAKYKRTQGAKAKHPDLYQIVSYCTALGLINAPRNPDSPHGILIYPVHERANDLPDELNVITALDGSSQLQIRIEWLDLASKDLLTDTLDRFSNILDQFIPRRNPM